MADPPIFKSGGPSALKNYRPISLLCIVSKVLEGLAASVYMTKLYTIFITATYSISVWVFTE